MPIMPVDGEFVTQRTPMLRLRRKDEKARILALDANVNYQRCHFVKTPAEDRTGRYYTCLGDEATVRSSRVDKERCPACAVAQDGTDVPVGMPRLRFAMHVARYRTREGSATPMEPMSLALELWVFSKGVYDRLADIKTEYGDLRRRDLILTCTNGDYGNVDMLPADGSAAFNNESGKEQFRSLLTERRLDEDGDPALDSVISITASFDELEEAVRVSGVTIEDMVAKAEATSVSPMAGDLDLPDLLGETFSAIPSDEDVTAAMDKAYTDADIEALLSS